MTQRTVEGAPAYPIWDLAVRLIHWSLPPAIALMWWTGEQGHMDLHEWVGYGLLCLILTRIVWGLLGTESSRFSTFLRGPHAIWRYVRVGGVFPGHNPLGALSVVALLIFMLTQAVTGLFSRDDLLFEGPFSYWVGDLSGQLTEWHKLNWLILQCLIALHLSAIAWHQWRRHEPLIQAMWSGSAAHKISTSPPRPFWMAGGIFLVSAMLLWILIRLAPEAPSYY